MELNKSKMPKAFDFVLSALDEFDEEPDVVVEDTVTESTTVTDEGKQEAITPNIEQSSNADDQPHVPQQEEQPTPSTEPKKGGKKKSSSKKKDEKLTELTDEQIEEMFQRVTKDTPSKVNRFCNCRFQSLHRNQMQQKRSNTDLLQLLEKAPKFLFQQQREH